jgi:hypothetical protein
VARHGKRQLLQGKNKTTLTGGCVKEEERVVRVGLCTIDGRRATQRFVQSESLVSLTRLFSTD